MLQAEAETDYSAMTARYVVRCGHRPGTAASDAFNSGVIAFRATPMALDFLAEWRSWLLDPARESAVLSECPFCDASSHWAAAHRLPYAAAKCVCVEMYHLI